MPVRPEIDAAVGGIPVRIADLSLAGARLEHEERFSLAAPQLQLAGSGVALPLRVIRTEIVGRSGAKLMYRTGVEFTGDRATVEAVLSPILRSLTPDASKDDSPAPSVPKQRAVPPPVVPEPEPVLAAVAAPTRPAAAPSLAPAPARQSLDDTWTRRINFLGIDPEDTLPYAQFRRSGDRWTKTYVATADQPEDGFTILRDEPDLIELQRTFEYADAETQQMMRIALKAKLERSAR